MHTGIRKDGCKFKSRNVNVQDCVHKYLKTLAQLNEAMQPSKLMPMSNVNGDKEFHLGLNPGMLHKRLVS